MYAMLERFTRRISTKRPGPYAQQMHWQVHGGGGQAVTSAKSSGSGAAWPGLQTQP